MNFHYVQESGSKKEAAAVDPKIRLVRNEKRSGGGEIKLIRADPSTTYDSHKMAKSLAKEYHYKTSSVVGLK
jgi:translation initiation factor 1 (eIF-1/SUI1)